MYNLAFTSSINRQNNSTKCKSEEKLNNMILNNKRNYVITNVITKDSLCLIGDAI